MIPALNRRLRIRTPEGVVFSLEIAGPARRCLAWCIDLACVLTGSIITGSALSALRVLSPDWIQAAGILAYFILSIGYGISLEWYARGQTIGKRLLGLRVMDAQGLRLAPSQIVLRNLLRFVDMLPGGYLVGGVASVSNPLGQRLGDVAANTVVVVRQQLAAPNLDGVLAGKYNSLREWPHLAARLRQAVAPDEARAALQALLRRDTFEPSARLRLFAEWANYFREAVSFPESAVDGLSDEQYVRNVVDLLFRSSLTAREPARTT